MRVFIAEKPELARVIANNLNGNAVKNDGYIQKGNDIITWAFGHILELFMPEDYKEEWGKWNINDLPLQIDEFRYKPKDSSKKQLKIICDLLKKATEVINCGDADEEGQILVDEIINYSNYKGSVKRLLLHDLTDKGVKKALSEIKNNSDFKGVSECGFARSQADWIVGINLTRAYTTIAQSNGYKGVLSVGRVQTPILAMIVARDLENENHKSSFYYTLTGEFKTGNLKLKANLKTSEKIVDEVVANDIKSKCENKEFDCIVNHENKIENPPLPYNLLLLQAECSKRFNYKPDKTLEITQSLREKHKLISYNRSDCEYLPENLHKESPEILSAIKNNLTGFANIINNSDASIKSSAFNDNNITAHYGIIPTEQKVDIKALSKDELNVYEMIAKRFVLQFFKPKEYLHTSVVFKYDEYEFSTSSNKTTFAGFSEFIDTNDSEINTDEEQENEEHSQDLSTLENCKSYSNNININKKQTRPRPLYTMATLLKDLTSVSKYVKDEKIKALLKEKDKDKKGESGGIGTPATRSEHIKKLFERGYIVEVKKKIKSSDLGRNLIKLSPKLLTTPDMTALWFENQKDIEAFKLSRNDFLKEVFNDVKNDIESLKNNDDLKTFASDNAIDKTYPCKVCNNGYMQKRKTKDDKYFWGCSNYKGGCFKTYNDKAGKPDGYNANIYPCKQCNTGVLERKKSQKGNYFWGCSNWRNGCKAMFYDDNGKPKK